MTRRLLLSYLALAAILLAALMLPLGITYATSQERDLLSRIERDAFTMANIGRDSFPRPTQAERRQLWETAVRYQEETGSRVVLVDERARLIADSEAPPAGRQDFADDPEIATALAGTVANGEHRGPDGEGEIRVAVPVGSGENTLGAVRIGVADSELDAAVWEFWLILLVIAVVMMGAVVILGLLLARSVGRPLERLRSATHAIGSGDLSTRAASVDGPPEVRELAASFDSMAERLEGMIEAQRGFASDASHQLRTPLAAIHLRLDNALEELDGSPARQDVAAALHEAERLNRMVTGLLVLARSERAVNPPVAVDVMAIVGDRIRTHHELAERQQVTLRGNCGPLMALAQPGALDQVLDNLMENAIKASPPGSEVVVRAGAIDGAAEIHVIDQGPGMPEKEREQAFERFWSNDTTSSGGTGLGLSIVRRLVSASRGKVELREAAGGGVDGVVRLPLAYAESNTGHAAPTAGESLTAPLDGGI